MLPETGKCTTLLLNQSLSPELLKMELINFKNGAIVLAPPFTALFSVGKEIKIRTYFWPRKTCIYEDKGAFTGEISPGMLKDIGCSYVIIGHSERRKYFHEQDNEVNLKIKKALMTGLTPIMCVGETDEERVKGITHGVIGRQVKQGLNGVEEIDKVVIAYEPVWAIGTGKVATSAQAQEVHAFIRGILKNIYGKTADDVCILYGGSVTKDNISDLIAMADIDGALVGGASLKSDGFLGIIKEIVGKE